MIRRNYVLLVVLSGYEKRTESFESQIKTGPDSLTRPTKAPRISAKTMNNWINDARAGTVLRKKGFCL